MGIFTKISESGTVRYLLVGAGGSLVILAFLFYAVSHPGQDVSPGQVVSAIKGSSIGLFILYLALALVGIWIRAIRYQILIKASGEDRENIPATRTMLLITAVRGMVVDLLPARLGELVYVVLLKRVSGTSIPGGLSSLIFAMVLDIAVLAPVTVLLAIAIGFPNTAPVKVALVAIVAVGVFYLGIRFILPYIIDFLRKSGWEKSRIAGKLIDMVSNLNDAVQATLRAGVLVRVLLLTIAVRGLKYIGLLVLFYSISSGSFLELAQLSDIKVLAAMIASEMTAALPIPTLMSFGAWEIGGMTFLALFGANPGDSLVTLLALHILTQSVDYGIGLAALCLLFMHQWGTTKFTGRFGVPALSTAFALGCFVLAAVSWYLFSQIENSVEPDSRPQGVSMEERPQWLQEAEGLLVWSSNRMGNHNIMIMDLADLSVRPLTIHPNTETHPRISPDGKQVAFSRSVNEWQSWRDQRPWNVWIKDIDNGSETLVANNAAAPSWSADGKTLYFNRNGREIWSYDFIHKRETKLFERNVDGLPDSELRWPSVDENGVLAVSYRDLGRPTNMIADGSGEILTVARGCMLTWSPDNTFAMFVSNTEGGRQENQINRYDRETGQVTKWLDLPGELSHEYFPRLDKSQEFLVFASSDGAHEPDLADYEIFIWKTDTPASTAQRLTFDRGNDSWPDVFIPRQGGQ